MSELEMKQLRDDVALLTKQVAAQAPHTILLLALAKTKSSIAHWSNIEAEIDRIPIDCNGDEIRREAKKLLLFYFPRRNA